ncbi:zf-DHHC-domain-containing protein [Dacryopinax primogenitus]|uniref:Palmitoyltransferase PFA4 n=1 Tax=Dacryopinax primogenitus (strain DJM 731) TaxID=1858805 RepID=M5GDN7_DACPD|nr:zf-DHHC-domain-containing protein [Dacryopinax primogenitus]EJU02573.1 zf-DHHC-domain-containing protein [Dacryopinax primogenitus]
MAGVLGRVLVVVTCFLIAFIAYSSQLFVFYPWYGYTVSVDFIWAMLPFNILVGLIWWNYYLVVWTDPGRIPDGWVPQTGEGQSFEVKQGNGKLRYCRTCKVYKPPRSHHCRECNACTLRMDHHCPWVNNCVGHKNYASFMRFLFFVDLACTYHMTLFMRMFSPTTSQVVWAALNFATCVPVLLAVGLFSLYHFYLLATNTTTIEAWEKDKVAMLVRRGRIEKIKFPYNLGMLQNLRYVLGPNPLFWCWPTLSVQGDGLSYPVEAGTGEWNAHSGKERSSPLAASPPASHPYPYPNPPPANSHGYSNGLRNPVAGNGGVALHENGHDAYARSWGRGGDDDAGDTIDMLMPFSVEEHVPFIWPPKDPSSYYEPRPMPESPWTYGSGVNPHLEPSNTRLRARAANKRNKAANKRTKRQPDAFTTFLKSLDNEEPNSTSPISSEDDSDPKENHGLVRARRAARNGDQITDEDADVDAYDTRTGRPKTRRGSEGWEVKPLTPWAREEIVRKYAARRGLEREGEEPVPDSAVGNQVQLPNTRDDDALLGATTMPAHRPRSDLGDKTRPSTLPPPDKYNRYVPSAEDSSSSEEDNAEDEGVFRDRVWEQHIDAWEGRVIVNESAGGIATNGMAEEIHGLAEEIHGLAETDSALE